MIDPDFHESHCMKLFWNTWKGLLKVNNKNVDCDEFEVISKCIARHEERSD